MKASFSGCHFSFPEGPPQYGWWSDGSDSDPDGRAVEQTSRLELGRPGGKPVGWLELGRR